MTNWSALRLSVAAGMLLAAAAWLWLFPPEPRVDWADVSMEAAYFLAVFAGFLLVPRRVHVPVLETGWAMLSSSLLLEVCDEFTVEPKLWGTYFTGGLEMAGLLLIGLGLFRTLRLEEEQEAARAAAEAETRRAHAEAEAANRELREALRMKDELVGMVAHDFRSALVGVLGWTELLEMRATDDQTRKTLGRIRAQARALAELASDTLTMARIEAGTLGYEFLPVRLSEVLAPVAEARATASGLPVRLEPVPDEVPVRADAARLRQVADGLIANALKFGGRDVSVRLRRSDGGMEVAVADGGPGISSQDQPRLFQRFSRLEDARRRKLPGHGLGLFICRAIVEAHAGRIWVESEPGQGATFRFRVPASGPEGQPPSDGVTR